MPKGRMLMGYTASGSALYCTVDLKEGTEVCKQCEGTGSMTAHVGYDGYERVETCECPNCDGEGVVYKGGDDDILRKEE